MAKEEQGSSRNKPNVENGDDDDHEKKADHLARATTTTTTTTITTEIETAGKKKKSKNKPIRSRSPFRAVGKAVGKVGSATVGSVSYAAHEITKPLTAVISRNISSDSGTGSNTGLPSSILATDCEYGETISQLGDATTASSGYGTNYGSVTSGLRSGVSAAQTTATTATLNTAKAVIAIPKKIVTSTVKGVTKTAEFTHHETAKLLRSQNSYSSNGRWGRIGRSGKKLQSPRESVLPLGVAPLFNDDVLPKMDPMFTKYIQGVTVEEWAETCWLSDGINIDDADGGDLGSDIESGCDDGGDKGVDVSDNAVDSSPSVFGSFLEATGNRNVVIGRWKTSAIEGVDAYQGNWDDESYSHSRIITYDKPGGGFSSGPIKVKQTQNFRYQSHGSGDETKVAIVAFTVKILAGIPYNDAFEVQVRWVASPMPVAGQRIIRLQVGCSVVFSKKVMVAGIIKSNTLSSSLDDQTNTLEAMKSACNVTEVPRPIFAGGVQSDGVVDDDGYASEDDDSKSKLCRNPFTVCLIWLFNGLVWIFASFTSAVVKTVLENDSVQAAAARFLVQVVEQASEDPEFGETITALFPSEKTSVMMERNGSSPFLGPKVSQSHDYRSQSLDSTIVHSQADMKTE